MENSNETIPNRIDPDNYIKTGVSQSNHLTDENSSVKTDDYGLPFESLDQLTDPPYEFEEMAECLWEDAQDIYIQSAGYNRFSPHYIELINVLEKIIAKLASFCITKAVLEQKGFKFPALEDLKIWNLYCMCGFHFRKCHEAFVKLKDSGKGIDLSMLEWEFRWYALSDRLKATEDRIRKIQAGKIKADSLLDQAETFRKMPLKTQKDHSGNSRPSPHARSFPVLHAMANDVINAKTEGDNHKIQITSSGSQNKIPVSFGHAPENPKINIKPDPGKKESDREMHFTRSFDQTLCEPLRYTNLLKTSEGTPLLSAAPPGFRIPSDEVRKKIRDKRKKKR